MLNDFSYYDDLDLAKDLLSDTKTVYRVFFNECCGANGKYWNTERYKFRLNKNHTYTPSSVHHGWVQCDNFFTETLDMAIASLVLNKSSNYVPTETIAIYDLTLYKICIDYEYNDFEDWVNYKLSVEEIEVEINRHTIIYKAENDNLNMLLYRIPLIMELLTKKMPYGFKTDDVVAINPIIRYPYFLYEGYVFKSKCYYHEKKEITGTCNGWWNHKNNTNKSEFNIFKITQFMEERVVYLIHRYAYYNGNKKLVWNKDLLPIVGLSSTEEVLKAYPDAIGISRDGVMNKWAELY
jgi:hypothetical protein